MPLVSVIIPNYNHAHFLEQRFQSVLNQTFEDFEVIVLDDCSTDNSPKIIERYKDHPLVSQVVLNDTNSGSTFSQWVKGISLAVGTWVWIAESDDWCEPFFLQTLVDGLQAHASCVIGYCQSYCIVEGNQIKWRSEYPLLSDVRKGTDFVEKHMLYGNAIFNASMVVWKREAFSRISQEFMNYRLCGDWLFWIELCMQGDVFISGKLLNYFRKHGKDVSSPAYANGLNFDEELQIAGSIYARGIVDTAIYMRMLKNKFLEYKLSPYLFSSDRTAAIENSFFSSPQVKKKLQGFYYTWKIKHTVRGWFT